MNAGRLLAWTVLGGAAAGTLGWWVARPSPPAAEPLGPPATRPALEDRAAIAPVRASPPPASAVRAGSSPLPTAGASVPPPSPRPVRTNAAAPLETPAVPLAGHPENVRRLLDWAERDAGAATLWADRLADPEQRREALQAICFKIAERDPRAAVDMAETFDLAGDPGVAANLVAHWSATDADAALAWVEQAPPGDARDDLVARVAFALSTAEPGRAAQVVEEHMSPGSLQIEAAASVLQQWMRRDAAAAARWAEGLPPGELRDRARRELAVFARAPH